MSLPSRTTEIPVLRSIIWVSMESSLMTRRLFSRSAGLHLVSNCAVRTKEVSELPSSSRKERTSTNCFLGKLSERSQLGKNWNYPPRLNETASVGSKRSPVFTVRPVMMTPFGHHSATFLGDAAIGGDEYAPPISQQVTTDQMPFYTVTKRL